ncbi:MAG TPA: hypothetical protein VFG23_19185 [Polyangia bacterium]|nr:hypothetical protein [Polyangia bacterium]
MIGLLDRFAAWIGRPRRYLTCSTCADFGMIESGNQEDVCPTCEGGVWRDRESWRWWLHRQPFAGWRVCTLWWRFPPIYKDWTP